jgi:DNA-binding NarL/FixJ family response regulator
VDSSPPQVRIGLIEDHEVVHIGLRGLIATVPGWELAVVARSVRALERDREGPRLDLVLLDLRLGDGSSPGDNVTALHAAGIPTLAYTAGEDPALLRAAARAGVLGVVRKSDNVSVLVESIRRALAGEAVATTDWAAALDGDTAIADAQLSPREREVLALYASGETAQGIAEAMGLSRDTIVNYVGRIRTKYALAGRPASTKVDLHVRAREDGLLNGEELTA